MFYKTWIILHTIFCATRFSMTSILADRTTETILTAITQCWFRLFGSPNEIVTDQEGAMTSEAAVAWSEHWHCALKFVPKGSHAHTVERHHEILRDCLHKIEDQCKTEGIAVNKEHILSEATFAKNAFVQIQGQSPYTAVLGRIPNLLLELEGNSSSAVIDSSGNIQGVNRHVTRLREIALQAIVEGTARSRLQIAERTKSRPSAAMSGAQIGQMVEIWRQPTTKDLVGWRGPCRIVSVNQIEHGLIEVEWQGRTMSCRLSDVRASTLLVLLISEPVGTPWQVVVSFLKGFHSGHVTCAWVYTDHGWQMSKVAAEQPLLLKSLLHTARFELGLTQCIGARLGRQLCQLPGMFGVELSLLLWWPTKSIHDYRSWEHPGHQTIDIKHIIRGANEHDISWVQFMCTEHSHVKELRRANMQLDPWWWNRPNGNHPGHDGQNSDSDGGDELGPLPSEAHMQSQDNDSSHSLPSTRHGSPVRSMNRYHNMSDDDASMPSTRKTPSPLPSTVKSAPSATSAVQEHETHRDRSSKRPISTTNSGPEAMQYRRLNPLEKAIVNKQLWSFSSHSKETEFRCSIVYTGPCKFSSSGRRPRQSTALGPTDLKGSRQQPRVFSTGV